MVERTSRKTRYHYNGILDRAQDIPAPFTGALDIEGGYLSIGSRWQPFIGLLDEVKIQSRVLTASGIKASCEKAKSNRTSTAYELVE